jgi:hypothetical protein
MSSLIQKPDALGRIPMRRENGLPVVTMKRRRKRMVDGRALDSGFFPSLNVQSDAGGRIRAVSLFLHDVGWLARGTHG